MVNRYRSEIVLTKYKFVDQFLYLKIPNHDMEFSYYDFWRIWYSISVTNWNPHYIDKSTRTGLQP